MLNERMFKFWFVLGMAGWVICFVLVLKMNSLTDIKELKDQQIKHSQLIKDILTKEIDAVHSKCKDSFSVGKQIKWKGQFSLVEKYCKNSVVSDDINNMAKCKEILECKPSDA